MSWGMNIYSLCGYVLRLTVIQHPRLHDTPKRNVTTATRMFTHSIIIINLACHVEMRSEATLSSWRLNETDFGEEGPWFLKKKIQRFRSVVDVCIYVCTTMFASLFSLRIFSIVMIPYHACVSDGIQIRQIL